ncbi:MAG: twin-arginine translocase TatA/TatE family subunit [Patescibacteria group bacterium]
MLNNIGVTELVVVAIIVIILFGGKKLPELGHGIGEAIREFKKSLKNKE